MLVLFVFHHFKQLPFFLKRTAKVVLFSSLPNLFLPFFVFFITLFCNSLSFSKLHFIKIFNFFEKDYFFAFNCAMITPITVKDRPNICGVEKVSCPTKKAATADTIGISDVNTDALVIPKI